MKKLNVLIIIIVLLLSGCGTGNVISDKTDSSVSEKMAQSQFLLINQCSY